MASNPAAGTVTVDALTEAFAKALKQATQPEPVPKGPTDRVKRCAALINSGKSSVYDAMIAAGYSRKFAQANAGGFPSFLAKQGLLAQEADRVYVGVTPTPEPAQIEIKEEAD